MLFGYWRSQVLRAIADLSIADHLAGGPLSAAEVATRENSGTDYTYRLMRAGVAMGVTVVTCSCRGGPASAGSKVRRELVPRARS